jgi:hypothetical protein
MTVAFAKSSFPGGAALTAVGATSATMAVAASAVLRSDRDKRNQDRVMFSPSLAHQGQDDFSRCA